MSTLRRLPFDGPDGKPAYTPSDSTGPLSLLADAFEVEQLDTGETILSLVLPMLEVELSADEARYMLRRTAECLRDALQVAESRGQRLGLPQLSGKHASGAPEEPNGPGGAFTWPGRLF